MTKTPMRMCVACREKKDKQDLIRLVKTNEGIVYDPKKKVMGRGFYLCRDLKCYELLTKKKVLNKLLSKQVTDEEYSKIKEYIHEDK